MLDISKDFNVFLGQVQAQTAGNLNQLTELGTRLDELAKQYVDVCRDLERERVAGRVTQQQAEALEGKLRDLESSTMRAAFVLVLVDADADAYLFGDRYYTDDPAGGGERAAVDLKTAVQQYLKSVHPRLAGLPIMARAFASGDGLATLMVKAGIAKTGDSQQAMSRFTCGFSQADEMFDFVLVGKGKDRADVKLTGAFRQFVESPSCQHVLLACCHENGYVRMLEKFVHSPEVVEKVTLVKSFQVGTEFSRLPFQSTSMEALFRDRPLTPRGASTSNAKDFLSAQVAVTPNGTSGSPTNKSSPPATYASRAAAPQAVAILPTSTPRPLPVFGTIDKDTILVNADGHRLDMPLPSKSGSVAERFNRRTYAGGLRYCNKYQLSGTCPGNCAFLHVPLKEEEKLVMRHKLRAEKCHDRGKCRDPLCYYGHHCACSGVGKKCNFPVVMHGVDVASWKEVNAGLGV
ncbi:hypothetical protein C8A01DRAFT_41030 [Parachaetomium inaequale]|uniref:C3H1-type domain-containing protein n=1 Tax=Parachaetomium inaequale TaxID=2588326 RepID=A0AAN6SL90_9PEZI|nr:hypothetical protein C8A01DRAFT_41030 [Parachaetomium inaequale]